MDHWERRAARAMANGGDEHHTTQAAAPGGPGSEAAMTGAFAGSMRMLETCGHRVNNPSARSSQRRIKAGVLMHKPRQFSARPLAVLLNGVFSDAFARQGFASRELVTRWHDIAGADIAQHCEPIKLQWRKPVEGQPQVPATLVLRVDGPMALEIQHM